MSAHETDQSSPRTQSLKRTLLDNFLKTKNQLLMPWRFTGRDVYTTVFAKFCQYRLSEFSKAPNSAKH